MYTVSRGPSKIVAKTRRGMNQNLERLENFRDMSRKSDPEDDITEEDKSNINIPKPVFYTNGKLKPNTQRHRTRQEVITPQHEELIKYICESWDQINGRQRSSSSDDSDQSESSPSEAIVYYDDGEPNNVLQDFKPFDLESWWGKRLFNNITKSG
ncbi:MAPK regulated corepressor interacting protein 2 [Trichogramma pretiosum]|uniref:MAPK regulated corepressor interacting protein 2 n=1 Tax=Trichogramma kaykai TaxID=54128 RepID=A0ABD2XAM8_9HYME|nr:MAPK regulated corepressor interacting protein 2 [Trichogramma pretiosum]XP_014232625.1 MAPK regulated corepressor interacting protein 2 [Trichogramma pretiosum]XP_014232626.1 MAPK regulated corepressor interacting protein 2 [Trichogramma pretiosum]XP_014232627.1 MAPK regulated corepressor interacting protein 2 [Trichogramma pretiosum]XP_014232628.1 MAPK regulated corepressor interacting protein 2 [Trichogramma pretiosum]XP_014232629.1 MAPK regulated corepressor interacting protein 2 [Trich